MLTRCQMFVFCAFAVVANSIANTIDILIAVFISLKFKGLAQR